MGQLTTFDPDNCAVVFGIPLSGFADGTFIEVEHDNDLFTHVVGADGDACRVKTNDRSATITITLLMSSSSNDYLSGIHAADALTPSGDGILPFMVKDNSGTTLCAAEKAWITKPAGVMYSKGVESRSWVLKTDNMISFVGGN